MYIYFQIQPSVNNEISILTNIIRPKSSSEVSDVSSYFCQPLKFLSVDQVKKIG